MTKGRGIVALLAAAVLVLIVVGVLVAQKGDEPAVVASDGFTRAPQLSGTDPITGKRVRLSDYEGRPVVINVRARRSPPLTCDPCQRRISGPLVALLGLGALAAAARRFYRLLTSGAITIDLGVGRVTQPLGPLAVRIGAPRDVVFEVIAAPYLRQAPRALESKLHVLERSSEMVLAEHYTQVRCGAVTTVETVRFEPPSRIHFRLVRGPVRYVVEQFELHEAGEETELEYRGDLGTDLWRLGRWWGGRVAKQWNRAVRASLDEIKSAAEARAARP
jgi:hypothetical protein